MNKVRMVLYKNKWFIIIIILLFFVIIELNVTVSYFKQQMSK